MNTQPNKRPNQMQNKDVISLVDMATALLKGWWLLLIFSVVGAIVACIYTTNFVSPMYRSSGTLYVSSTREINEVEITQSTITSSQSLATTYAEILKGRTFLAYISDDVGNIATGSEIASMLSVTPVNETEILNVSITTDDPEKANLILDSILDHARDELLRIVKSGSVEIVDEASMPTAPISPNLTKNVLMGFMAGFVIAAAILILRSLLDSRIKSAEDIQKLYPEPILGEIPLFTSTEK